MKLKFKKSPVQPVESPFLLQILQGADKWTEPSGVSTQDKHNFIMQLLQGNSLRDLQKRSLQEAEQTLQNLWDKFQVRDFADIRIDLDEDAFGQSDRVDITIMQRQIPFITDSILNLLSQSDLSVVVMLNAQYKVRRNDDGRLLTMHHEEDYGPDLEADKVLHIQCEHRGDILNIQTLQDDISDILRDVHAAVEDWRPMQGQISETIIDLEQMTVESLKEDAAETVSFLNFLKEGNFTFLGYREHSVRKDKKVTYFDIIPDKSLGLLRDQEFLLFDGLIVDELIPHKVSQYLAATQPLLTVLKANRLATVHRNVHMDVLIIKQYNDKGIVTTLRLFAGLFTSQCYAKPTDQIPFLKRKVQNVLQNSGFDPETHPWRSMKHVLDNYPRNELFQIDIKDLKEHAEGINRLNHRPDVDVFIREDILQRYFSVLVYLPKEEYDTKLRLKVQAVLQQELKGTVAAHYITVDEKPLARLLYMIATEELLLSDYDVENIRTKLIDVCTPWQDALKREVLKNFSKKDSQRLLRSLTNSFSISYQDQVSPKHAVEDLEPLQKVLYEREMLATLYHRESDNENEYRVKIYKRGEEASLSDLLPILDRMGFHCLYEYSYLVKPSDNLPDVWIHDLVGTIDVLDKEHIDDIQPLFAETFEMCWHRKVDSDSYNSLILSARLTWREANLFRALGRYLDLARYPLGKRYISQVLTKYAQITRILCDIFLLYHDPKLDRENANQQANELVLEFNNKLETVEKIDEDRILRSMLTLIENILRTNYFHPDSTVDLSDVLIFKFNASNLKDLPQPRPYREIFIFGPRVEAVHLRGGPIARGGIRWSDRFEDFRTEVLGLVKAQMVKNAVIVPVGAKGGFICKNMSAFKTPQERQQEGIACYQIMIKSLLSITDNIIDGQVVYPNHTVRRDQDDPYLVVAADKGTATFSDIANKISVDHGFWLGDAFASGGSKGYDHKAMGITARGAWECIKRHFRELGKDIQKEEFVVAGVGDMSGDVFGNGMILSPFTKLVAAFDHRHIFVDPNPDLKKSFAERKRLFEKLGSSWMDYDTKIMSKGAMIYNRQDKSLTLTPEIQALLDIQEERVTPSTLMQAILRSKVELLYFGGIGTYIKSSQQTHEQVGDKGNDPQRINASELRCKVVGEGANLAITQLARIEFAQRGGKINTDFIDNSAGVDTSDHEVNIKILLQPMVRAEKLSDSERDKLLVAMTNDVAQHVLKNNYDQSLALSLLERRADEELAMHAQFMRHLEHEDLLNREIEDLPDDESIQRLLQRHVGLTRPELAVILAYSKMTFFTQLMRSSLPDDVALNHQAVEYFPDLIVKNYQSDIMNHKLKRDIIATEVANVMINRMGPTFASNIMESSTASAADVATAWLIVRSIFGLRELWEQIDALDNILPATLQMSLYEQIITIMEDGVKWFLLHHGHELSITKLIPLYREQLQDLVKSIDVILPESLKEQREERQLLFNNSAIKDSLKIELINLPLLMDCCDIILIQQKHSAKAVDVANIYFALSDRLHIATLNSHLEALPAESSWVEEVIDGLQEDIHTLLSSITQKFLLDRLSAKDIEKWVVQNQDKIMAIDTMLGDIARMGDADLSLLTVAVKRLNRLKEVM